MTEKERKITDCTADIEETEMLLEAIREHARRGDRGAQRWLKDRGIKWLGNEKHEAKNKAGSPSS